MLWRSCSVAPRTVSRVGCPCRALPGTAAPSAEFAKGAVASAARSSADASARSSLESFDIIGSASLRRFRLHLGLRLLAHVRHQLGTRDPAGDTRTYPCISWWSAEQKSVQ